MDINESLERSQMRCPHCGRLLEKDSRFTSTFHYWATYAYLLIISLMLLSLDFVQNGTYTFDNSKIFVDFIERTEWSKWAVLGLWLFYFPAQYLRSRPTYGWLIIPIFGILFDSFFFILDRMNGPNEGFLGTDWAFYVIIPITAIIVAFPLVARVARIQATHLDQLSYLVESLSLEAEYEKEN